MPKNKYIRPVTNQIIKNEGVAKNKILIGTATTGTVRIEWVMARFGQIIPCNWSSTDFVQWISSYMPLNYVVPDAQNLIVKVAIEKNFEWLLLLESDNVLPPDAFLRINDYMRKGDIPVVSGLYFTKTDPAEPLVYRGRGNSFFGDWKLGDKVWVDGCPTGFLLIHTSILRKMWEESPEYRLQDQVTRRVFEIPEKIWYDVEDRATYTLTGTSDLIWCDRVIKGKFLEKAGWPKFQKMKYPFLIDTNIFLKHIDEAGRTFPLQHPKDLGY